MADISPARARELADSMRALQREESAYAAQLAGIKIYGRRVESELGDAATALLAYASLLERLEKIPRHRFRLLSDVLPDEVTKLQEWVRIATLHAAITDREVYGSE